MTLAELPLRVVPPQVWYARRPHRFLERHWLVNRSGSWMMRRAMVAASVRSSGSPRGSRALAMLPPMGPRVMDRSLAIDLKPRSMPARPFSPSSTSGSGIASLVLRLLAECSLTVKQRAHSIASMPKLGNVRIFAYRRRSAVGPRLSAAGHWFWAAGLYAGAITGCDLGSAKPVANGQEPMTARRTPHAERRLLRADRHYRLARRPRRL